MHPSATCYPPSCITAIYTKTKAGIEKRCSLQIRNTNSLSIPTPIAPNVWILTLAPIAVLIGIMLICLEAAPRFIKNRHPSTFFDYHQHAVLHQQHFHLSPQYEPHEMTTNISHKHSEPQCDEYLITRI